MRRLALLACLLLPATALAQPWATESARQAGRQALAAANADRWTEADSLAAAADPVAAKLVTWMRLTSRTAPATAAELVGFIEANPDWPFPETLARRAEEALTGDADDSLALRHFIRTPPRTLEGAQRFADALARAGRSGEAREVLRRGWAEANGDAFAEDAFLGRHRALLTEEDAWRRFDRLMFSRDVGAAARAARLLTGERRALADARLAFAAERPDAERLAPSRTSDLGLIYERARWLRRQDRDAEAATVWASQGEAAQRAMSDEAARAVWTERHILSRKLLRLGEERAAYRVAAAHGQAEPGEPRQEGEFLAGFIALRRLNDPTTARRHFAMVGKDSRSVITRARSAYWEGRALAARGETARAREKWEAAASLPVAFYGQLGSLALGEDAARLSARITALPEPAVPPDRAVGFAGRELARAVVTLADLGDTNRARIFLLRIESLAADATDRLLAARLANAIGRPDHAVWIARRAGAVGTILLADGWPMPYQPPVGTPEPAFVFAITRQESNFDRAAVSSANARGLMQLLPSTAQQVARKLGLPHRTALLTTDPEHNMRLGAAYLEQMLDRFDGSLALAAAAYNAGPRRVDEWIGTYGDPRNGQVDKIDWIEMIPFSETRNYVQRVIENVVVYRARNGAGSVEHPLARWLRTGQ